MQKPALSQQFEVEQDFPEEESMMPVPDIEPSDMYKAFQYVQRHLDEWIVKVDDNWNMRSSLSGGDEHLPMHRDQIDLFYSQEAQSLRLIDHEHDMVITAKYNVWSD